MTPAVSSMVSEAEQTNVKDQFLGHTPDIQTLGATTFDHLLASHEVTTPCALQIGECTGLLGATFEDITLDSRGNTDQCA